MCWKRKKNENREMRFMDFVVCNPIRILLKTISFFHFQLCKRNHSRQFSSFSNTKQSSKSFMRCNKLVQIAFVRFAMVRRLRQSECDAFGKFCFFFFLFLLIRTCSSFKSNRHFSLMPQMCSIQCECFFLSLSQV